MIGVVFVCLGNICRSPMAEAIFLRLVRERGVEGSFAVCSRATSDCEEGNPVYYPAAAKLKSEGYEFTHRSTVLTLRDVKNADYVLVMDAMNMYDVVKMTGGNCGDKIFKLGNFCGGDDIADPWFTRDFDRTYDELYKSCSAFLDYVFKEHANALDYDKRH